MQDKGLHRLKMLAKARHCNRRPGIVPYENACKIGGAQVLKKLSAKSVQQYIDKFYKKGVLYLAGKIK